MSDLDALAQQASGTRTRCTARSWSGMRWVGEKNNWF